MIYKPDRKITDLLAGTAAEGTSTFTYSAEVIPPRNGANQADILAQIAALVDAGSQFLAVTKGAGGSLRGGSLPIAQLIKERFNTPCIAHFTCRDLTPAEIENQLMDHGYFGIRNILALRGDPPQGVPDWKAKDESYPYAYQLIEQIARLNRGHYLERPGFKADSRAPTDFTVGAAVYPDHANEGERVEFFRRKVEAGAEYAITQMLFDEQSYGRFLEDCDRAGLKRIPVLPGTRILKSRKQAARMAERFEVKVSPKYLDALPDDESPASANQALDAFYEFVGDLRRYGAPGLHLFVLNDTELGARALRELRG